MIATVLSRVCRIAACVGVCVCVLAMPACTSLQDLIGVRLEAGAQRERLEARAAEAEAALAGAPPDDPAWPALEAELARAQREAGLLAGDIERLDAIIAEAQHPSDPIAQAVGALAPFVPEPARTPLVLGGALVGALVRMHQLRRGLSSVARGFEVAKRDDPEFRARFEANAPTFSAMQTPLARRVIARTVKGA